MKNNNGVFIIAEAGINHNGDIKLAKKMVDAVKAAGADCIKFQTFKTEEFVSDRSLTYTYQSQGKEVTEAQFDMFKRCELQKAEWQEIIDYCRQNEVVFGTTAQNLSDLDLILSLTELSFIKVGSDDLTNLALMTAYAKKGRPMIISAGMAYASEIEDAVLAIQQAGNNDITVLHCVSSYPTAAKDVNLNKISTIRDSFKVKVGFSDHTVGSVAAIGAVCFGAGIIEKHFTLDHDLPGPDHWFSVEPEELKDFVRDIRFIEGAIGKSELVPTVDEIEMRKIARRSIVAARDIKAGVEFTLEDFEFKRPGVGLPPKYLPKMIGKISQSDYPRGFVFTNNDLQ